MSGTSADGIDAALVSIAGSGPDTALTLERFMTLPYPADVRERVADMARGCGQVADVARWHHRLGRRFGEAAAYVLQGESADLVGSHGQTVAHLVGGGPQRATLQLGSPAMIAAQSGLTVVSDFRAADIAAGGEGAPLVSFVDWLLLRHTTRHRVILNIGGIANITYLPPHSHDALPTAFDTGPGNAPIDRAVHILSGGAQSYDRDGELAARGTAHEGIVRDLLSHPFVHRQPPKSTGLEEFGHELAQRVVVEGQARGLKTEDILATLTRFTATSIAHAIRQVPMVEEIVVSGGGWHNHTLRRLLQDEVAPVPLQSSDALGIPSDAKEAVAFAVLANQTIRGRPGNLPACTGASHPVVLGSITPGENFGALMRKLWT